MLFAPLEEPEYRRLLDRWSRELEEKLWQRRSVRMKVEPEVSNTILAENPATPDALRRSFLRSVENLVASDMLKGKLKSGESYRLVLEGDRFKVRKGD